MTRKGTNKGGRVCIAIEEETKNRLRAMGSKGDTYDDVINGLIDLVSMISDVELASTLAKESKMSDEFIKELNRFYRDLAERGKKYRNCDYEVQKLLVRLDLLS